MFEDLEYFEQTKRLLGDYILEFLHPAGWQGAHVETVMATAMRLLEAVDSDSSHEWEHLPEGLMRTLSAALGQLQRQGLRYQGKQAAVESAVQAAASAMDACLVGVDVWSDCTVAFREAMRAVFIHVDLVIELSHGLPLPKQDLASLLQTFEKERDLVRRWRLARAMMGIVRYHDRDARHLETAAGRQYGEHSDEERLATSFRYGMEDAVAEAVESLEVFMEWTDRELVARSLGASPVSDAVLTYVRDARFVQRDVGAVANKLADRPDIRLLQTAPNPE